MFNKEKNLLFLLTVRVCKDLNLYLQETSQESVFVQINLDSNIIDANHAGVPFHIF